MDNTKINEHRPAPKAIIYRSELDYISRCILDYPNIETGGELFGLWTGDGIPVVLYAIGPGRDANHQTTFFNQDIAYLKKVGNLLVDTYSLQHIGEWHSHHQLGLARPSGHDASTMINGIRRGHLRRFLLCIGNCTRTTSTLNAFNFHEEDLERYVQATWVVKEMESPFRPLADRELSHVLVHPETPCASYGSEMLMATTRQESKKPNFTTTYWLSDKKNNLVLKSIVDFLIEETETVPQVQLDENAHVHIVLQTRTDEYVKIYFPMNFPYQAPQITLPRKGDDSSEYQTLESEPMGMHQEMPTVEWRYAGNILDSFCDYYLGLTGKRPPKFDPSIFPQY